jgi:hypothetical protein
MSLIFQKWDADAAAAEATNDLFTCYHDLFIRSTFDDLETNARHLIHVVAIQASKLASLYETICDLETEDVLPL